MSAGASVTLRRATPQDVEPILDLLTEYGRPRSYFEPFYLNDTSYRPEHSWVIEQQGRLLSHLRVYDRWIRIGRAKLRIAGIGNVITAQNAHGYGYAGQLMLAMLTELQREEYAYSLLWTHTPNFYEHYGWVPIEQQAVRASLPSSHLYSIKIVPFEYDDLPAVMRLYDIANAERTGMIIRSREYWREQPTWLHEKRESFLVARDSDGGPLVGYGRSRVVHKNIELLELGLAAGRFDIGRALLTAASRERNGQLEGRLPPSQRAIFLPDEFEIFSDFGLMGRAMNLTGLISALEAMWQDRIREAGVSKGSFQLSTRAGRIIVQVSKGSIRTSMKSVDEMVPPLNEREFAHLLFQGVDEHTRTFIENRPDASLLQVLFPKQDFAIWQADTF